MCGPQHMSTQPKQIDFRMLFPLQRFLRNYDALPYTYTPLYKYTKYTKYAKYLKCKYIKYIMYIICKIDKYVI